jgi:CheY-like chemotaxis protein
MSLEGVSVLVVEDHADHRELARALLTHLGARVDVAEDGQQGLEKIRKDLPNLVLCDLLMPEMDGFEFVAELRKRQEWQAIPVIVITAKDLTTQDRERLNGYVVKIVEKSGLKFEALIAEIHQLVSTSLSRKT